MGFGEKDGEEFDQVKVALVPFVELHVPDEFRFSEHVVASDHAAVPPVAELHPDVSFDEVVRVRGGGVVRGGGGGVVWWEVLPSIIPAPWIKGECGGGESGRDSTVSPSVGMGWLVCLWVMIAPETAIARSRASRERERERVLPLPSRAFAASCTILKKKGFFFKQRI
jgi:hypothetical protein